MGFEGDARALWSALDSDNSGITGFEEVSPKNAFSWRNMHVLNAERIHSEENSENRIMNYTFCEHAFSKWGCS